MKPSDEYLKDAVQSLSLAISALFEEQTNLRRPEPLSTFLVEAMEYAKEHGIVRLFSVLEASKILGVSSSYVEQKIHSGEMEVIELGTSRRQKWRISALELQRYIDNRTIGKK
ncbi:excisionase family DNA binding protein [Aurantimicrobium minutum]|uniref:excisionase family DNA-binding protein n=1 Tax=Aurantimicrobium minutum TaxID=708131 RepID=UPI002404ABBA|nr:excisionase family DNA-binding protein [Aurantimicrobium minutum]MDF9809857.1 excisionase family DNA binding protein [Aurantimicrobium minutum]